MYLMLKDEGVIASLKEFRHLTIAQLRFFIKKNNEYREREKRTKELNKRLNQSREGKKP